MKVKVKIDDQILEVEIRDLAARPIVAVVEGECIEVWPEGEEPRTAQTTTPETSTPRPARPASAAPLNKAQAILAPIPGVILEVKVCEGAAVEMGQEVCVLEAMKMKNSIRSTRAGKIGAVRVAAGDHVKHGQVLMEYEE